MELMIYWNNKAAEIGVQMFMGGGVQMFAWPGVGHPSTDPQKQKALFRPAENYL
jgi:hypothetical protein